MPRKKLNRNVARSRQLRRKMTLPEVLLWQILRQVETPRFRRQYGIDDYTLDFYCPKAKVCIEVDGYAHNMGERPQRDEARDACLAENRIEVLRIPAREVLDSPEAVADGIVRYCESKIPLRQPA